MLTLRPPTTDLNISFVLLKMTFRFVRLGSISADDLIFFIRYSFIVLRTTLGLRNFTAVAVWKIDSSENILSLSELLVPSAIVFFFLYSRTHKGKGGRPCNAEETGLENENYLEQR